MKKRYLLSVLVIASVAVAGSVFAMSGVPGSSSKTATTSSELINNFRSLGEACGSLSGTRPALRSCVGDYVDKSVKIKGPKATAIDLEASVNEFPEINIVCHTFAHYIGRGAWEQYHSIRKALNSATNFCAWGYLHGMNVAASKELKGQELLDTLMDGCAYVEELNGNKYECAHGIGDAFVDSGGGDDLLYAFEWCRKIPDPGMHANCSQGAANYWMDYRMVEDILVNKEKPTPLEARLFAGEPYAVCLTVDDRIDRDGCLDYATHLMSGYKNGLADLEKACHALEGRDNSGCFKGLGREYAFTKDLTPTAGVARCQLAKEPLGVSLCMADMINARTQVYRDKEAKIYNEACSPQIAARDPRVERSCAGILKGLEPYFSGDWQI